jgi:hypothetical protein
MPPGLSRRELIVGMGVLAAGASLPAACLNQQVPSSSPLANSPFRIAVINDEISQDFGHACEVAAQQFGMGWIEIRGMWNKNVANLDASEITEALRILKKYGLRVTDIASPL